jgi:hypothetical protein
MLAMAEWESEAEMEIPLVEQRKQTAKDDEHNTAKKASESDAHQKRDVAIKHLRALNNSLEIYEHRKRIATCSFDFKGMLHFHFSIVCNTAGFPHCPYGTPEERSLTLKALSEIAKPQIRSVLAYAIGMHELSKFFWSIEP